MLKTEADSTSKHPELGHKVPILDILPHGWKTSRGSSMVSVRRGECASQSEQGMRGGVRVEEEGWRDGRMLPAGWSLK